jgi:S-adenosylmethionine:tRNA ribosyltransferase-isomerase
MRTDLFDYDLPTDFIAQQPAEPRDASRLMVLHRADGRIEHRHFADIGDYLDAGDVLVGNDSRVIPARLHGHKTTGGAVEVFLLRALDDEGRQWECLTRGRNVRADVTVSLDRPNADGAALEGGGAVLDSLITATVVGVNDSGTRDVQFSQPIYPYLDDLGEIPLPPYITEYTGDRERYQTIYSRPDGSAAAPTAGLHFSPDLLVALRRRDIFFETVTLHVGLDTFKPVEAENVEEHLIHTEWAEVTSATARRINDVTLQGGRVVGVGTTTVRTLEWAATGAQGLDPYDTTVCPWKRTAAFAADVDLFIRPGYRFRAVDVMITNFHLPRSSLLMMVSAFIGQPHSVELPEREVADPDAGRRMLLNAYEVAKQEGYRFYSFGDAMLIV